MVIQSRTEVPIDQSFKNMMTASEYEIYDESTQYAQL
jgi:hypothetical protein